MAPRTKTHLKVTTSQSSLAGPSLLPEKHRSNASSTATSITVRVPLKMHKRGGRKVVLTPGGAPTWAPVGNRIDSALVKAVARAHRWARLIENGQYGSVTELAATEKINMSYVCRMLRLTRLAPDLVEAILDGRMDPVPQVEALMKGIPLDWAAQRERFLRMRSPL